MSKSTAMFPYFSDVRAKSHRVFPQTGRPTSQAAPPGGVNQVVFVRATDDNTLTEVPEELVSLSIDIEEGSRLSIDSSVAASAADGSFTGQMLFYQVRLDGITITGAAFPAHPALLGTGEGSVVFLTEPLSAGSHTVSIIGQAFGGNINISAFSSPNREHVQLKVEEILAP